MADGFPKKIVQRSEFIDAMRQRAAERGMSLTPEQEDELLRRAQAKYDAGETDTMVLGFDDPPAQRVRDPITAPVYGTLEGLTGGYSRKLGGAFDEQAGDPLSVIGETAGGLLGMMLPVGAASRALGAGRGAGAMRNIAASGAAGAGYGALASTGGDELDMGARATRAGQDALMFSGLVGAATGVPKLASQLGGPVAGLVAERAMGSRLGKALWDTGIFTGLDYIHDGDATAWERVPRIAGGVLGAGAASAADAGRYRAADAKQRPVASEDAMPSAAPRGADLTTPEGRAVVGLVEMMRRGGVVPEDAPRLLPEPPPPEPVVDRAAANRAAARAEAESRARRPGVVDLGRGGDPLWLPERAGGPMPMRAGRPGTFATQETARAYQDAANTRAVPPRERIGGASARRPGDASPRESGFQRRWSRGRDATTDMLGMQQLYEALESVARPVGSSIAKAARWTGNKITEQALKDLHSDGYVGADERRWQEIPGVPESKIMSYYGQGKITAREMVDLFEQHRDSLAGAYNEKTLEQARADLKEAGNSSPSDGQVYARAMANTVPPAVKAQIARGEFGNVNPYWTNFLDPRRTIQGASGGKLDSAIEKHTKRLGEMAEMVEIKMAQDMVAETREILERNGIKEGSPESESVGLVLDRMGQAADPSAFYEANRDAGIFRGVADPSQVMRAAAELRGVLGEYWSLRNKMTQVYNGGEVGRLGVEDGGYFPYTEKQYSLLFGPHKNVKKWWEQSGRKRKFTPESEPTSTRVMSGHERRRTGRLKPEDIEWDTWRAMDRYITDEAGRIAKQVALSSSESIVRFMEKEAEARRQEVSRGRKAGEITDKRAEEMLGEAEALSNSSAAIRRVMQSAYNGVPHGINKAITNALMSVSAGARVNNSSAWMKRRFNAAKYILNVPFIVARQWTSLGLIGAFPGVTPKMVMDSLVEAMAPYGGELSQSTYTGWRKSLKTGGLGTEGNVDTSARAVRLRQMGRGEAVLDKMSIFTNKMENFTSRYTASIMIKIGREAGLSGKALMDFVSDGISKTQSDYHSQGMAEIRKNPVLNMAFPAQSFSLEGFNMGLEVAGRGVGVDMYSGKGQRAAALSRMAVGMFLTNQIYEYINTYQDLSTDEGRRQYVVDSAAHTLEGLIPWSSLVTGSGPGGGRTYFGSLKADLFGGDMNPGVVGRVSRAISAEKAGEKTKAEVEWERAGSLFTKNFIPGGGQMSRVISADFMIKRGILESEDFALAATAGWWATENGKKYLRRLNGIKSEKDKRRPYVR